jgi:phosphatidate phosphatase APP1
VFIHDAEAPFLAVISDIDDTVVNTHVTDKKKLAATVLLKNAAQLEPVEGAARNYAGALSAGASGIFYLSGSPQNFYPRLRAFLDQNAFPRGPLLLKNLGDDALLKQQGYKGARIDELFARFPNMRAILVGDSGEKDPEIYKEAKAKHGDRVVAIVIRKAAGAHNHDARFEGCSVVEGAYASDSFLSDLIKRSHASENAATNAGGAR